MICEQHETGRETSSRSASAAVYIVDAVAYRDECALSRLPLRMTT